MRLGISALVLVACSLGWASPALAANDTVTNTLDGAGTGPAGSLRNVIANSASGDMINFAPSVTGTITLTSGAIPIAHSLTITGPGAPTLTIDGNHASQVFVVSGGSVSISGLTLAHGAGAAGGAIQDPGGQPLTVSSSTFTGNAAGGPGGAGALSGFGQGGAISAGGALTVSASRFTGNAAGGPGGAGADSGIGMGGAINVGGALTVSDSSFTGNTAGGPTGGGPQSGSGQGGAINVSGALIVSGSSFAGNTAGGNGGMGDGSGQGSGGAISAGSALTVSGSTFSTNAAGGISGTGAISGLGQGGAIFGGTGSQQITNSTLTRNSAGAQGHGGALYLLAATTLVSDTIDGNAAGTGSGGGIADAGFATTEGTIVSGNAGIGGANCDASVNSSSYSMEGPAGATSCGFDLASADPLLGLLADNGGPTQTQALPAGSPAIDVIPSAQCSASTDQRGLARPDIGESLCDLGAFESGGPPSASITTPRSGATYTLGQVVDSSFSCTSGSGGGTLKTGTAGCSGTAADSSAIDTLTPGSHTFTVLATGTDGQTGTASTTYTVIGPPSATILSPAIGASYVQGQPVSAGYSCQDAVSGPGIKSCAGPVADGSAIDTSTVGPHSFSVTATSLDGLTVTVTSTYTVLSRAPAGTGAPQIFGTPLPGDTLICSTGTWANNPTAFTYQWNQDGKPIAGATGAAYTVQIGDEAQSMTCTVTASNSSGPGPPATSAAVLVAVQGTLRCPQPSGRLSGLTLGPLELGLTRAQERRKLPRFRVIGYGFDNFCLYGGFGIRVGYPSTKLLRGLSAGERASLRGTIVIALTANPYYVLDGVKPGTGLAAAAHRLKLGKPYHIGVNYWYIARGTKANEVLKVRHRVIQEVGIADKRLTESRGARLRLLSNFAAD